MRRRVVFVLPDFFAGGAQKVMLSLAGGLDRGRFDPAVIVLNGTGPWSERVPDGIPVTNLDKSGLRSAFPALRCVLRRAEPDIVVSTMGYLNLGVLLLKPALGRQTRFIVREANALFPEGRGGPRAAALKFAYRHLYARAHQVISPSKMLANELVSDLGVHAGAITVLRNPVEIEACRSAASPVKRRDEPGPQFVCVGRLSRQKAYDRLLGAIAAHDVQGHVTIFGEGPERPVLENKITELGLKERVTLAGFDPNPAPWVAGADALLLPSRWEGLPNVALEALALGTPVIAAPEAGAIAEIAALAKPGAVRVVPMGEAFAQAMSSVQVRQRAGVRPSQLPDDFHPETVNARFQSILQACVNEAR